MSAGRGLLLIAALSLPGAAAANDDRASYAIGGKHFDRNDVPTFQIDPDGNADWFTATGFQAYHQLCRNCHGPKGSGSEYGAALVDPERKLQYFDFTDIVVNGQIVQSGGNARVMPAFGTNPEVMCRLDAIYIYLRAETAGALDGKPPVQSVAASKEPAIELDDCLLR